VTRFVPAILLATLTLGFSKPAEAQGRTDVVTLANGDRITGEIVNLERGRLEFKTDDAGTLYLEWDKLVSLVAARYVEVVTRLGIRYLGTLGQSDPRSISVVTATAPVPLTMVEVTLIRPLGTSFWSRLDGSFDTGFSYTQSSGIAQLNLNSETIFQKPASRTRLFASLTLTQQEDESRDDRGTLELSYLKYPWQEWFISGAARFESNESLGIRLRSQVGTAIGPRLVNSNRGQLAVGAGIVFNDERGVDVEPTRNIEALLVFRASYYTYDRPKTNLDLSTQYYPSLSDPGRHRLQLDAAVKRELWKDFFVSLSMYNTFDSRPPNPAADTNDIGVVMSIGYSY
jgi:hypothetical protein